MNLEIKPTNIKTYDIFKATNQENPKQQDIEALDKAFNENPQLWENIGNIANRVKETIIQTELGKNHLVFEATKRKLADLRDELGWENSSRLEKVIIEQICLNWLRHNLLESVHSRKLQESHTIAVGDHWDKLINKSHSRYLRSCESLAKVRKMLAEADLKHQQARTLRSKTTAITNKLLKDLTN